MARGKMMYMVTLLFFIVVTTAVLAGCSNEEGQNSNGNQTEAVNENGAIAEEKPEITVSFLTFRSVPADEGTPEDNRWTRWINENAPVKVNYVPIPGGQMLEKYTTLYASGDAPDLIWTYNKQLIGNLIDEKLVMPLNDLIKQHSVEYKKLMEEFPETSKVVTASDGNMYSIARVKGLSINHVMMIRDDWLENLGLDVPRTFDELYNVAKAFAQRDPDDNGEDDTYGISLGSNSRTLLDRFFGTANPYLLDDKNGTLIKDWTPLKKITEFSKTLYDESIVDRDFLTDTDGAKEMQDFINGKLGIYGMQQGVNANGYNIFKSFKENNPDGSYTVLPLPEGASTGIVPPFAKNVYVNSQTENPEAVMKYIDFLVKDSTGLTLKYGFKGEHWEPGENGCPQIIDEKKFEKEVSWNNMYYEWVYPELKLGACRDFVSSLDSSNPLNQEFIQLYSKAYENYITPEHPPATFTHYPNFYPKLPEDLQMIVNTTNKTITDIMNKSIVSGSSYTVDQAMEDAKQTWYDAGGQKVDDWLIQWYEENKDKALLNDDIYSFYEKQKELMEKVPEVVNEK